MVFSICPGQYLADSSLYLTVVSTLSLFEITNAVDKKTGLPIVPLPNYKPGVIWYAFLFRYLGTSGTDANTSHPEAFECLIKPRYSDADILAQLGKA